MSSVIVPGAQTLYVPRGAAGTREWERKTADERERVHGSALVFAKEWREFLEYHLPKVKEVTGWVRLLVAGVAAVHQGTVVLARRLRKNANWAGAGTEEDWLNMERVANEKLAWFRRNAPSKAEQLGMPRWGVFLLEAVEGALLTLARIAREVGQIQRRGHLLVNVSPLANADGVDNDPTAEEQHG